MPLLSHETTAYPIIVSFAKLKRDWEWDGYSNVYYLLYCTHRLGFDCSCRQTAKQEWSARSTESNPVSKSRKIEMVSLRNVFLRSDSCRIENIWSTRLWPGRRPAVFSRAHISWIPDNRWSIVTGSIYILCIYNFICIYTIYLYIKQFLFCCQWLLSFWVEVLCCYVVC